MDTIAQIKQLRDRVNAQSAMIEHLIALEENNAAMIAELIEGLKASGALVVVEKKGFKAIEGGKPCPTD